MAPNFVVENFRNFPEEVGHALCAAKNNFVNLLFPGYYKPQSLLISYAAYLYKTYIHIFI